MMPLRSLDATSGRPVHGDRLMRKTGAPAAVCPQTRQQRCLIQINDRHRRSARFFAQTGGGSWL